jgi:hypothetical protein
MSAVRLQNIDANYLMDVVRTSPIVRNDRDWMAPRVFDAICYHASSPQRRATLKCSVPKRAVESEKEYTSVLLDFKGIHDMKTNERRQSQQFYVNGYAFTGI